MILLSALLASLSGLVAGERAPVRAPAQVQASAVLSVTQPEAAVAAARAFKSGLAAQVAAPAVRSQRTTYRVAVPPARTRLAIEQSWLE